MAGAGHLRKRGLFVRHSGDCFLITRVLQSLGNLRRNLWKVFRLHVLLSEVIKAILAHPFPLTPSVSLRIKLAS